MTADRKNPHRRKHRSLLIRSISVVASLASASAAGTRASAMDAAPVTIDTTASSSSSNEMHARRRLEHTERTLAAWRSLKSAGSSENVTPIRPLDLKIDQDDPSKVYQVGAGGFLEPYDFVNYQEGFGVKYNFGGSGNGGDGRDEGSSIEGGGGRGNGSREGPALSSSSSSLSSSGGNAEGVVHVQSERMGLTNFDLNRLAAISGYSDVERRMELGDVDASTGGIRGPISSETATDKEARRLARKLESRSSIFKYTLENDPYELQDDTPSQTRHLQRGGHSIIVGESLQLNRQSAEDFVTAKSSSTRDDEAPIIRSTFPPVNTKIGPNQSFGALVTDNGTGVKSVCLQFKDHTNSRSDCFELVMVGSDVWELSFDGFNAYEGETWAYRVRGKDGAKNRANTEWADFIINISGKGDGGGSNEGGSGGGTTTDVPSGTILTNVVRDESWPYGGVVQQSTGRILFFFDGNAYVCTGTVIQDDIADRTIVLTAAHCAYQYAPSGGRFAEHALYIPDQDDTTGVKSDDICSNDPYGCWVPAFAVVDYQWTQQGFPNSVPYDFAFYVIPNDVNVHEKGYLHYQDPSLSEILPDLVEPMPIDFNFNQYSAEMTTGLGYSFDKDPDFRYCAGELSTKYGIRTYENLWIGVCEMTGGSSGGPWMIRTDSNGRGTVVSVNSWGYTSSPGMGGPNLSTGRAECLYERAKSRSLNDYGGYAVTDC
ncbi:hypothetical protein ACHAW6_006262 [Cyclotella cf. meneghiniana]